MSHIEKHFSKYYNKKIKVRFESKKLFLQIKIYYFNYDFILIINDKKWVLKKFNLNIIKPNLHKNP